MAQSVIPYETPQDVGSGVTSSYGTFIVKQVHVFHGIVTVAFEIKLTRDASSEAHIMEGLPYAKGRFVNVAILQGQNVIAAYMNATVFTLKASISSGLSISGCFSYVT